MPEVDGTGSLLLVDLNFRAGRNLVRRLDHLNDAATYLGVEGVVDRLNFSQFFLVFNRRPRPTSLGIALLVFDLTLAHRRASLKKLLLAITAT